MGFSGKELGTAKGEKEKVGGKVVRVSSAGKERSGAMTDSNRKRSQERLTRWKNQGRLFTLRDRNY